ncbi:MAG: hypothetical protein K6E96_04430 [Bacteroidales bacterium]|nr:hypothetical protein [Bacteroidales bacterium]
MKRQIIIISMLAVMVGSTMAQTEPIVGIRSVEATTTLQDREIVTFTTHNQQEAIAWAKMMKSNDYYVVIEYNPRTGIYTCTAVR